MFVASAIYFSPFFYATVVPSNGTIVLESIDYSGDRLEAIWETEFIWESDCENCYSNFTRLGVYLDPDSNLAVIESKLKVENQIPGFGNKALAFTENVYEIASHELEFRGDCIVSFHNDTLSTNEASGILSQECDLLPEDNPSFAYKYMIQNEDLHLTPLFTK